MGRTAHLGVTTIARKNRKTKQSTAFVNAGFERGPQHLLPHLLLDLAQVQLDKHGIAGILKRQRKATLCCAEGAHAVAAAERHPTLMDTLAHSHTMLYTLSCTLLHTLVHTRILPTCLSARNRGVISSRPCLSAKRLRTSAIHSHPPGLSTRNASSRKLP